MTNLKGKKLFLLDMDGTFYLDDHLLPGAKELLELEKEGVKADVVIVDPPRKGLSADCIEALHRFAPRQIVYVSCDPATLARDVALLKQRGYRVVSAQAADLFPRCAHVESIVCLSKQAAN